MLRLTVAFALIAVASAGNVIVSGLSTAQRIDANIPVGVAVASPATAVVAQQVVAQPTLVSVAQSPLALVSNGLGGLTLVNAVQPAVVSAVPTVVSAVPSVVAAVPAATSALVGPNGGAAVVSDGVAPGAIIGANGLVAPASVAVGPSAVVGKAIIG